MNETEFQVVNEVKNRAHAVLGHECNFFACSYGTGKLLVLDPDL
jgi:hypothetical protein